VRCPVSVGRVIAGATSSVVCWFRRDDLAARRTARSVACRHGGYNAHPFVSVTPADRL
jgi:hypothetical protein